MAHFCPKRVLVCLLLLFSGGCGGLDGTGSDRGSSVTLTIQNPDETATGTSKALSLSEVSQSKAVSNSDLSECTLTATGPNSASNTVYIPSGVAQIKATLNIPTGKSYTICAECIDTNKTTNNVGAGIKGCTSDINISASANQKVSISALFYNLASRSSGDVKYCRFRQDSTKKSKIVCGFNGTLTTAQKLTAQCNIEFDTSLSVSSPATVDASRSNGFVSGTKGKPYFTLGPGQSGQIAPACHQYNTSASKKVRGTGAWGSDTDGNTTIECTLGVKQMESLASGRNARFAASCTKDGTNYVALPSSGMAEFNISKGGNEDVTALAEVNTSCSADSGCGSGFCGTSNVCVSVGTRKILYDAIRALDGSNAPTTNNANNIWSVNEDGTSHTALTSLTAANVLCFFPRYSPDGTKIAYFCNRALDGSNAENTNSTQNLWIMNADGSGSTPLTRLTTTAASGSFSFSLDGSKIVHNQDRALDGTDALNTNGTNNVWVDNVDGSGGTALTSLTADNVDTFFVHYSPDGSKIIYDSGRALDGSNSANTNNAANVWIMNADGSGATPLTRWTTTAHDRSVANKGLLRPQISPDGSKIVYESHAALDGSDAANTNETGNIWVINIDGSGNTPLTRLTVNGADSIVPKWSPDGIKIVYYSKRALDGSDAVNTNSAFNVWVINADGTENTPLTSLTVANITSGSSVHWSPDGDKIICDSRRALDGSNAVNTNNVRNVWILNADGSGNTPLTSLTAGSSRARITSEPWSP